MAWLVTGKLIFLDGAIRRARRWWTGYGVQLGSGVLPTQERGSALGGQWAPRARARGSTKDEHSGGL